MYATFHFVRDPNSRDDTVLRPHTSHAFGHEILDCGSVSQLRHWRMKGFGGYYLGTSENVLLADGGPPIYGEKGGVCVLGHGADPHVTVVKRR